MRLESSGIKAFIPDEGMATANPILGNAIGGIRVQVQDEDAEQAREILGELAIQAEKGDFVCPKCGSDNVTFEHISTKKFFIGVLLLGFPFLWIKGQHACRSCGNKWR